MALSLYVGPPGSGKSYEAISSVVLPAFKSGRSIVTNIKGVRPDYWEANIEPAKGCDQGTITVVDEDFFRDELNYPLMTKGGEVAASGAIPPGALVVIDEAYTVFPTGAARETGVTPRMIEYVRTHRHFVSADGVASDLVLISQDVMSLHPRIRAVAEFVATVKNMRYLGLAKRYRVNVFSSWRMNKASAIGEAHRRYSPDVFKLYKSFEADGAAKVVMTDKSHRALKPYHLLFVALAVGLIVYAATRINGARLALSAKELTASKGAVAPAAKPDCAGSGALVDLADRRVFLDGVWKDVGETKVGADGKLRWDIGPCFLRFS